MKLDPCDGCGVELNELSREKGVHAIESYSYLKTMLRCLHRQEMGCSPLNEFHIPQTDSPCINEMPRVQCMLSSKLPMRENPALEMVSQILSL